MRSRRRRTVQVFAVIAVAASVGLGASVGSVSAAGNKVKPPPGALAPVAGTGIGTQAAMSNPRCHTGAQLGAYGVWPTSAIGTAPGGQSQFPPLCVRSFKVGENNGGATSPGVTATSITLVVVVPTGARATQQAMASSVKNLATGQTGTFKDAAHDWLLANMAFYQTWGRNIDVKFYDSTGIDETSQRADLVAIKAMKPFAVVNFDTSGLQTLMAGLAQAKIIAGSFGTTGAARLLQAPYRWGGTDYDAAGLATAEMYGKNLAGKKAQYAGSDVSSQTRKLGAVVLAKSLNVALFKTALKKWGGGTLTSVNTYPDTQMFLGDPAIAAQYAPGFVTRMKAAGVTTVALFADTAMNAALMNAADSQNWHPEWLYTGANFSDVPALATTLPSTQSVHAFGVTTLIPFYDLPTSITSISGTQGTYNWFYGPNAGTDSRLLPGGLDTFLSGVQNAGPRLTPKTYRQGLFAAPAIPNPENSPLIVLYGYGKTTHLPYDAYTAGPADFTPFWMDPNLKGPSVGFPANVKTFTTLFFPGGGRRYYYGSWPKNITFFKQSNSISTLDNIPSNEVAPQAAPPCPANACFSTGATALSPGTPSPSGFVAQVNNAAKAT